MTDSLAAIKERIAFAELNDMAYAATPEETAWLVREVERLRQELRDFLAVYETMERFIESRGAWPT